MTRFATHSAALFAALLFTVLSLNAVVTVPPAHAFVIGAPILA